VLMASGFDSVCEIAGGLAAWESANLPVQSAKGVDAHHAESS
jgi:hypothetical protein